MSVLPLYLVVCVKLLQSAGPIVGEKAECPKEESINKLESMRTKWSQWGQIRIYKDKLKPMFVPITSVLNNTGDLKNELMSLPWSYIHAWVRTWRSSRWRSGGHWRAVGPAVAPCRLGDSLLPYKFCPNYSVKLKSRTI